MRLDPRQFPIRTWTALSGTGLLVVFAVLIIQEATPAWRRHQHDFFRLERLRAERGFAAANEEFRGRQAEVRLSSARVEAAEQALRRLPQSAAHDRVRRELETAGRELSVVQDTLQRLRADYQRIERDFILADDDSDRARLRSRLEALRLEVEELARRRERLSAARDEASRVERALTADVRAARESLAKLESPLSRARADLVTAGRRRAEVQQFLLDSLGHVDRCTSCHIASTRPGFEKAPEPLRSHVGRYLEEHPPERFGCTICHGGQGRATRLPAAHGAVAHWRQPLLSGDLVGARCAICHRGEDVPAEPYARAGRRLFLEAGCHGCHEVEGVSAPRIGPPLANIGRKVRPQWLAWWLRDPKAYLPRTRMPNFLLGDQEIADISAFLLSPTADSTAIPLTIAPSSSEAIKRGDTLFKESRCVTCHALNGRGGVIGPDLARVSSKIRPDWLRSFLHEPARLHPGTKMPRYRFSDRELTDLVAYVSSELRDFDEGAWPPAPSVAGRQAEGRRLVRSYGCFGCHLIPPFEQTGRVGAELTGYADKEVDRLDFGLRRDVPRSWRAWTETKLRQPRSFRDGLKMPDFAFSGYERFSLLTYLASLTDEMPPGEYLRDVPPSNAYEPEGRFGELAADLNCLVCHTIRGRGGSLAPNLTREGSRVRPEWLRRFLDRPDTIRPSLEERMPRFRLGREEVEVMATYIENVLVDATVPKTVFQRNEITPSLIEHGRTLYYSKYACDSCHQVGMKGGAVGPDLTAAARRLTEGWIYSWLRNSRRLDPAAREPAYELDDKEARAITAFLLSLDERTLYSGRRR